MELMVEDSQDPVEIDSRLEKIHEAERGELETESNESEDEDYESSPSTYEINTFPADFTLEVLHQKWKGGDIDIPKFQRQFVWKQVQASKLIESFLVSLPVPAIFLYVERQSQKYLVIDGQQRLKSIFAFFDGYFGENKETKPVFRLKGLNETSKYYNKTFSEMSEADQRKFKNCILRAFIVQQVNPDDDTSIYHVFERLNTGGSLLTNQEVRNCVYHGKLNDLLHELNKYPAWRSIVGKQAIDSHQKDVELILRFFSLINVDEYEKPLKDHMSKWMKKNRNSSAIEIEKMKDIFQKTCDKVITELGQKPFHVKLLNTAIYDAVMVAFSENIDKPLMDMKDRYKNLLEAEDFRAHTRSRTTDNNTIRSRFSAAKKYLFG